MQPFMNYTMINFFHWMTINYPKLMWSDLMSRSEEQLRKITKKFEETGGNKEKSDYNGQWYDNLRKYSKPPDCDGNDVWEDPLKRYSRIPLHAIFLYTSMNKNMGSYIVKNWCAIHRASADYCDIHPTSLQFKNREDASNFITYLNVIKDKSSVKFSELPGIYFWDHTGETEYVSFSSDQSDEGITKSISIIIDEIKEEPTIRAVRWAKRKLV